VTGRDVPDDDMPNFPWLRRRDASETADPSLAAVLAWAQFPESSAPEMQRVGEILAALTAGPADDELAGEAAVLAAYRSRPGVPRPAPRTHRQTRRPLFPLLPAKAAATAAAAVISFGAFATAAYARALPAPVQQLAHVIIGAPTAEGKSATSPYSGNPGATGPNGATGQPAGTSPTGRAHPSPTPHATGRPSTPQDSGQPSSPQGSGQPTTPQGSGTPTPTHKPHPTPHGTGKPTHPPHGNG